MPGARHFYRVDKRLTSRTSGSRKSDTVWMNLVTTSGKFRVGKFAVGRADQPVVWWSSDHSSSLLWHSLVGELEEVRLSI